MEVCRERLASLSASRASLQAEASLLEGIAERVATDVRRSPPESVPVDLGESASPISASAPSPPLPESTQIPAAKLRSKVEIMLDVLRDFGRAGASPRALADACAAIGADIKHESISSYLSQKKKQGLVVGQDGLWWVVEYAPTDLAATARSARTTPRSPQPGLSEAIRKGLRASGEQGAPLRDLYERVVTLRPGTTLGALSSCLSKFRKRGEVHLLGGRYVAAAPKTAPQAA